MLKHNLFFQAKEKHVASPNPSQEQDSHDLLNVVSHLKQERNILI